MSVASMAFQVVEKKSGSLGHQTMAGAKHQVGQIGAKGHSAGAAADTVRVKAAMAGLAVIGVQLVMLFDPTPTSSLAMGAFHLYKMELAEAGLDLIGAVPAMGKVERAAIILSRMGQYKQSLKVAAQLLEHLPKGSQEAKLLAGAMGNCMLLVSKAAGFLPMLMRSSGAKQILGHNHASVSREVDEFCALARSYAKGVPTKSHSIDGKLRNFNALDH